MGEVDLLLLLIPFVHREIDDPAEVETILVDQLQLLADLRARETRKFVKLRRVARDEESCVTLLEAQLISNRGSAFRTDIVGKRSGPLTAFAPHDVAHAGL